MDIKVAAAGALAVIVGLGVQGGLHYRHHVVDHSRVLMLEASNNAPDFARFDADWNADGEGQAEQFSLEQPECLRKSLESSRNDLRQSVREQLSSAQQERRVAFAQDSAATAQLRSEIQERIREQRGRFREQQQSVGDQIRQQRDHFRDEQRRLRDQIRDSE